MKAKSWCGICMVESVWELFLCQHLKLEGGQQNMFDNWKMENKSCVAIPESIFWEQWSNWALLWFSWRVCLRERVHIIPLAKLSTDVCINTGKKSILSVWLRIVSYTGANKLHNWNVRRRKEFEIYSHSGCNKDLFFASPSCDSF